MFEFKHEIEQFTGKKIDINKQIDQAQKEAKNRGQKIDDKYIKQIKKDFHKQDKKHKHRAVWFAQCAEVNIPYSTLEADLNFDMNYIMANSAKNHQSDDLDVPIPIMVGITVSLCGLFLILVPLPGCQTAGGWLITSGVSILYGDALQKWDAYDRDQKVKKQ